MPRESKPWCLLLALAIPLGLLSCAEVEVAVGPAVERKRISSLTIRDVGSKVGDEAQIRGFIASKPGTNISSNRIDGDIKALYESGLVTDVRFLTRPKGDAVRLIAEIETRPSFGPVRFVGNTTFSDQKLSKACKLKPGQETTEARIQAACRNTERFYERHGFQGVKVTSRWEKDPYRSYHFFIVDEGVAAQP